MIPVIIIITVVRRNIMIEFKSSNYLMVLENTIL